MKVCIKCKKEKSLEDFIYYPVYGSYSKVCKACRAKEWRKSVVKNFPNYYKYVRVDEEIIDDDNIYIKVAKERKCLKCDQKFITYHNNIRLCHNCREENRQINYQTAKLYMGNESYE